MSNTEMMQKIKELKEMKELIKEAEKMAESLEEEIKEEMRKRDTEELEVGIYVVRWTTVLSNRFDSNAFKAVLPDVYKAYVKQSMSKRFTISG